MGLICAHQALSARKALYACAAPHAVKALRMDRLLCAHGSTAWQAGLPYKALHPLEHSRLSV